MFLAFFVVFPTSSDRNDSGAVMCIHMSTRVVYANHLIDRIRIRIRGNMPLPNRSLQHRTCMKTLKFLRILLIRTPGRTKYLHFGKTLKSTSVRSAKSRLSRHHVWRASRLSPHNSDDLALGTFSFCCFEGDPITNLFRFPSLGLKRETHIHTASEVVRHKVI